MYKHILIAVDGSEFSIKAAEHALRLARSLSAKVSAVTVQPAWQDIALSEIARGRFEEEYEARARAMGERILAEVATRAAAGGIACSGINLVHTRPYEAIVDAARTCGADLIVVGSHGRRGVSALMLGSEAAKLLAHSAIPVLVYRE